MGKRARGLVLVAAGVAGMARMACAMDVNYPPDPVAPASAETCHKLNQAYWSIIEQLEHRPEMRAAGTGPQIMVGQCCIREAQSVGWCTTFASVAAVFEEVNCAELRRREAMARREASVGFQKGGERALDPLKSQAIEELLGVDPAIMDKANKLISYLSWLQLAQARRSSGNGTSDMTGLAIEFGKEAGERELDNPVVREIVLGSLDRLRVLWDSAHVEGALGEAQATIDREFPGVLPSAHPALPKSNPPATNADRLVYECKQNAGGGPPSCDKSRWNLDDLMKSGADCQPHGAVMWCF